MGVVDDILNGIYSRYIYLGISDKAEGAERYMRRRESGEMETQFNELAELVRGAASVSRCLQVPPANTRCALSSPQVVLTMERVFGF